MSRAYIQTGELDRGIDQLKRIVRSKPYEIQGRLELGVLYAQNGKTVQAIEQFEQGLDIDPHQVDLLYNLGIVLTKSGHADQAIPYLERAESIDSTSVDIAYALASSYAGKKDFRRAEDYYLRSIHLGGLNPSILEDLGHIYHEDGQWQKAIEAWEMSLEMDSSNTRLQRELLLLKEKMGNGGRGD
jgi:tetratricopeptide (TPR) repeat protein